MCVCAYKCEEGRLWCGTVPGFYLLFNQRNSTFNHLCKIFILKGVMMAIKDLNPSNSRFTNEKKKLSLENTK